MKSRYKCVIFDMDGTLTKPVIDFQDIRKKLDIAPDEELIAGIERQSPERQQYAWNVIKEAEAKALEKIELQNGVEFLFEKLWGNDIYVALLTRNSEESVAHFLKTFPQLHFYDVMTREARYIKPDPRCVEMICNTANIAPKDSLMVGDYIHDIEAGRDAGTDTCFFKNPNILKSFEKDADYTVTDFYELDKIIFPI